MLKIMKNFSKEVINNELRVELEVLKEINKKIEEGRIKNQAHKLYEWKFEAIGAIHILEYLLLRFEENERE